MNTLDQLCETLKPGESHTYKDFLVFARTDSKIVMSPDTVNDFSHISDIKIRQRLENAKAEVKAAISKVTFIN